MRTITKIGIGAAVLLANVAVYNLAAAQGYPRLLGSGDGAVVEYGAGTPGNIVGGGRVALGHDGDSIAVLRQDEGIGQRVLAGQVPVARSVNGTVEVVLVPTAPEVRVVASTRTAPQG